MALANTYPTEEIGRKSLFMLGETYYKKYYCEMAEDVYARLINKCSDDELAETARIIIGWSYLRQGNWRKASEEFQKLSPGSSLHNQAEGLTEEA
jgi:TolA-binding protein